MSYEIRKLDNFTPQALFGLLQRKHLLTLPIRSNPALLATVAVHGDFYTLNDRETVLAYLIETRSMEPGILDLALVPEDKNLCLHEGKLAELAPQLRDRWFKAEGWEKVQVQVAKSRKNTCRTLKALGFICETRSIGIRKAVTIGKEAEALMIYGLLESDPVPTPLEEVMEVANA